MENTLAAPLRSFSATIEPLRIFGLRDVAIDYKGTHCLALVVAEPQQPEVGEPIISILLAE
jgi:hypothetical protein